tara:strand:- start:96 stop:347 length:252 start_codon:yes stop_codon:yes gene_type:complete
VQKNANKKKNPGTPENGQRKTLESMSVGIYRFLPKKDLEVAEHMHEYKPDQYYTCKGHEVFLKKRRHRDEVVKGEYFISSHVN